MKVYPYLLPAVLWVGCESASDSRNAHEAPVVTSLLGATYYEPHRDSAVQARLDDNLETAQENFEEGASEENYIWLGRRTAYLLRFQEAVNIFSDGIEKYPDSYKLFRHRGHRYISLRQFDRAVADLQQAAAIMPQRPLETEPDGIPNKINKPLSSTQFNVWYHLGLAHYLLGDFASAEKAYLQCWKVSNNDDLLCATADWLYMTFRRQGKFDAADEVLNYITDSMTVVENDSYYKRLMMYKGKLAPEEVLNVSEPAADRDLSLATQGYGVGNWYLCQGDSAKAYDIFRKVVKGKEFAAFGFIAAEAELARLKKQ